MELLRITTVQANLVWEDKIQNFQKFDDLLRGVVRGSTDVIVLPEMFTTGFSMKPIELAEPMNDATLFWLKKKAWEVDAVVTGSFICEEDGKFFNRLIWMQPDGVYSTYDKRHRFTLAGEDKHYTEGGRKLVVEWRGWRICPLICYDLRFPIWSRNRLMDGQPEYDVLIYVANWPSPRSHHWRHLLEARAIENQAYVVGVNRVGEDAKGYEHRGDTSIIDYAGDIILRRTHTEGADQTVLSKAKLADYRKKFGFLFDQDAFEILL
jgi:predicted amidohydrolase